MTSFSFLAVFVSASFGKIEERKDKEKSRRRKPHDENQKTLKGQGRVPLQ